MGYNHVDKIHEDVQKLADENDILVKNLSEDYESDVNDWCRMRILYERCRQLDYEVSVCANFIHFEFEMEDEKDIFLIKKYQKQYLEIINFTLDRFITITRTWKFKDYRCRDWLKRAESILLDIKEFYFPFEGQQ